jgi:hypothetical protein
MSQKKKLEKQMKRSLSRREFMRWSTLITTAFLAACQKVTHASPTASQELPAPAPTDLPDPIATQ